MLICLIAMFGLAGGMDTAEFSMGALQSGIFIFVVALVSGLIGISYLAKK